VYGQTGVAPRLRWTRVFEPRAAGLPVNCRFKMAAYPEVLVLADVRATCLSNMSWYMPISLLSGYRSGGVAHALQHHLQEQGFDLFGHGADRLPAKSDLFQSAKPLRSV